MKKIIVTVPCSETAKEYLAHCAENDAFPCTLIYKKEEDITSDDLADTNVILGQIAPAMLQLAPHLEWLQLAFAGADPFVKEGVLNKETILTNASGAYGLTVSEHMVAMTFALNRRFGEYMKNQSQHIWKEMGKVASIEGATVLVLGLGDIGQSYARKMKALGAYVIGIRRTNKPKPSFVDEQYTMDALDSLLPRADYTAMVLPGGDATAHVMNEARLRLMKKGSFILNDGRGNAIDLTALKKVLKEGHLAGAGLDVTEPEPLPLDDELWDMPNVILTPHIAGKFLMEETYQRVLHIMGENLLHYTRGETLEHIVDCKTGY